MNTPVLCPETGFPLSNENPVYSGKANSMTQSF